MADQADRARATAPASAKEAQASRRAAPGKGHDALAARPVMEAELDRRALLNGRPAVAAQRKAAKRLAGRAAAGPRPAQPTAAPNRTGLPDRLKAGVEALSGVSMDGVKVHYGSPKPAQLDAAAFAQGTDIHLAPGQERHLPHEAWHVVQQAQGRVGPTVQMKNGVPVNDDAGLEHEADMMGARANRNYGVARQESGESEPSRKALAPAGPVQMAGHAGVMIFGNNGKLLKRIERNEWGEFKKIKDKQDDEDAQGNELAKSAFPIIYRVLNADQLNPVEIKQQYGDGKAVREWLDLAKGGDFYVEMQSLGGEGVEVLDFKVGTATAARTELMRNYGKSGKKASEKVAKMARIDATTESARLGLRDSDAMRASKADVVKRYLGNFVPTLTEIVAMVAKDKREGRGPYSDQDQPIVDLGNIRKYVAQADTVYIASSLVMKWNRVRASRHEDRVVLIDLAHPVTMEMEGFETARAGMLLGIDNLSRILRGEPPQEQELPEEELQDEEVEPLLGRPPKKQQLSDEQLLDEELAEQNVREDDAAPLLGNAV